MDNTTKKRSISIVVPVFREQNNLHRLRDRLLICLNKLPHLDWEVVFVNDGSPDDSLKVLREIGKTDTRYKIVDLARNFGKEVALSAGVHVSSGDAVICMDADLQHPPEIIPQMISAWEAGAEVVATVRSRIEKQPLLRRMGSHLFYWIMSRFSEVEMVSQTTDFRLIDRKVVEAFKKVDEKSRMFRGIIDWLGFRKVWIEFDAAERKEGKPGYSYGKLMELAFNSFISYSHTPLRIIGLLGVFISVCSFFLLIWMMVAERLVSPRFYYTPLAMFVVANTFLFGVVLSALGLISLYISKIYSEVIARPLYVVRELVNFKDLGDSNDSGGRCRRDKS